MAKIIVRFRVYCPREDNTRRLLLSPSRRSTCPASLLGSLSQRRRTRYKCGKYPASNNQRCSKADLCGLSVIFFQRISGGCRSKGLKICTVNGRVETRLIVRPELGQDLSGVRVHAIETTVQHVREPKVRAVREDESLSFMALQLSKQSCVVIKCCRRPES